MTIIKSLIRTYFMDLAIDTAVGKLWMNFVVCPKLTCFPKNAEGLLECARRGELHANYGREVPYNDIKEALVFGFPTVWAAIESWIAFPERFIEVRK